MILAGIALITIFFAPAAFADGSRTDFSGIKIAVDAGHGGSDPGALGPNGLNEATANLQISQILANLLGQNGAQVIMTRNDDSFVDLNTRPAIANQGGADAFVSVHLNSSNNAAATGTETYYFSPQSAPLATAVYNNLVNDLGLPARGISTAHFAVIDKNNMPAILTEASFISNPNEAAKLATTEYQTTIATAIFKGLKDYFGVTTPPPAAITPPPPPAASSTASPAPPASKSKPSRHIASRNRHQIRLRRVTAKPSSINRFMAFIRGIV